MTSSWENDITKQTALEYSYCTLLFRNKLFQEGFMIN
jgi:hypothetical protein